MTAGFPVTMQSITGTPMLRDLFRTYRHLMYCAELQFTVYHVLNWLFPVVPPNMWNMHSIDPHPDPPESPGLAPNYILIDMPLNIIKAKDPYNNKNKKF